MGQSFFKKIARKGLVCGFAVYRLCNFIRRPLTLGVVAVIFNEKKEVLMLRHSYRSGWCLPAGGVKKGESVKAAICRELKEELNVNISSEQLMLKEVCYSRCDAKHDHAVLFKLENFEALVEPDGIEVIEAKFCRIEVSENKELNLLLDEQVLNVGDTTKKMISSCL